MRMLVIDGNSDLEALSLQLFGAAGRADAGALEALKRLNPHIDFDRIGAGTILLVPDMAGLENGASRPVASDELNVFSDQVTEAIDRTARQVRRGHQDRIDEQDKLKARFDTPDVLAAIRSDDRLQAQLERVLELFAQDRDSADTAVDTMEQLREACPKELAALAKLLGS